MHAERPDHLDERVLVLAPTARDATTTRGILEAAGIRPFVCNSIDDICREGRRGAGAAILTAEAVLSDREARLKEWLQKQPPWSDFPLIVLAPVGAESPKLVAALEAIGHMTFMQRPVQVSILVSTIRSAIRDRRRQYAVRDLFEERRLTAESLRQERERYRVTLASIGEGVIATDTSGRVTFLNPVAEQLTGWDEGALGRPLEEVFHIVDETSRQPIRSPALRASQEGISVGFENHSVLIARDSSERPLDESAAPIRGVSGEVVGTVVVFRDITERKRAERAIREQEQRALDILQNITDAFLAVTRDWQLIYVNRQAEEVLGREPGELQGEFLWDVFPGLAGSDFERAYRKAMDERTASSLTSYYNEHQRWYEVHTYPSSEGIAICFRDVTERVEAETLMRESELRHRQAAAANAKFRAFFEQGTNFAGVLALDGKVIEANRLCLDACGYTREEVLQKPFWECGWWNRSITLMAMIQSAFQEASEGHMFRTETNYYIASGAVRMVDLTLAPVTDETGSVLYVAATGTDITERKMIEDALRDSDRKKDDFIALLAHELRNPLAPIRNGLQVMRLAGNDSSVVAPARAMMERQLGHMVRLIDDLLDVSRINRNKMELRRSRVLLTDILNNALEAVRPAIEAAGHELTLSLPPQPIFLDADLTRLAQVFANLLTNSTKYTERSGQIWLGAESLNGTVIVTVRDTGIGIPANSLPTIFEMFSQVDRSIERSTGGLGIGLALVKGLVEMHGGTVTAASAGEGKGSTFTVTLPELRIRPEPLELTPPDAVYQARGCGRRFLVVDDNRDAASSMATMLELTGDEVCTAHDGIKAVEAAEHFRPEFILMDIGMPRMNGLEATRRIRAQPWGKSATIIALTGWGQESDRIRSTEAGCDAHLVKPVTLSDLEKLLANLIDARNGGRPKS